MREPGRTIATLAGLVAILLWSGTFALARSLSEKVGPLTAGAAAYLFGSVFCASKFLRPGSRQHSRAYPRRYLFGCGALFILYTIVIYLAVGLCHTHEELLEVALVNYL